MIDDDAERLRVEALHSYQLLDTASEAAFDDLATMAAELCDVPIAVVSLIDAHRQWSKAAHGCPRGEVERELSFCTHAIESDEALVVPDAQQDPRFCDNMMVVGEPYIRLYAGQPLIDRDGHRLGTLCLIDRKPRELDSSTRKVLDQISRQVVHLMELRRSNRLLKECLDRVGQIAELVPMCSHCHSVRDGEDEWQRIEQYFRDLNGTRFTHGVCPACLVQHYPSDLEQLLR